MKINNMFFIAVLAVGLLGFSFTSKAQTDIEEDQLADYEDRVKDIVNFLEYVLNTLGSRSTSARDKDVIINESYTKIFRDSKVQIEDDLDENRDVVTNKDVQAYLKDVDFFFRNVFFDFNIEDISHYINEDGKLFFKVSLTRNLKAIDIEGDSVNNSQKRFIEVNLDPEEQDLKIASIYTHQYSREEALTRWWDALSYEWHLIFKNKVGLKDSLTASDIENLAQIEELDVSGNQYITTIEPLSMLTNLKRLNISNTNIQELKPIRNLTELEELNISNTGVAQLVALKYASALRYLDLNNTSVTSLEIVSRLHRLESLNISHTAITDITPVGDLQQLKELDISSTPLYNLQVLSFLKKLEELNLTATKVSDLQPLAPLKALQILKADSTPIASIAPLSNMESLKVLSVNYTVISDLSPLSNLPHLERVYCDVTVVTKSDASQFMAKNPGVLVIFESDDLKIWWIELPEVWKNLFKQTIALSVTTPTKEELAKITAMDSLNISGTSIKNLEPLIPLRKLQTFIARNTAITDLNPLKDLRSIAYLDVSGSNVSNFEPLTSLENLKVFKANQTALADLNNLMNLGRLTTVEIDSTFVTEDHILEFTEKYPACLVIFKSATLRDWWKDLGPVWRSIFSDQSAMGLRPSKEQLHRLILLQNVQFSNAPITDLSPLNEFLRLKKLKFSGTAVSDLSPLTKFTSLEELQVSRSPLSSISPIRSLKNLRVLDISSTPIDDLDEIATLYELRELNCSGTPVRNLKDLDNLANLKILDCSNTRVRRLKGVDHLDLKVLKCYNTRISERKIEQFKLAHPACIITYY